MATSKADIEHIFRYLEQGEVWLPKDRVPVAIPEMGEAWRQNAARWLERKAAWFEWHYSFGEISVLSNPTFREVVGCVDGVPATSGRTFSFLDLMGDDTADAFNEWSDERMRDPASWIKSTPLYRALVATETS